MLLAKFPVLFPVSREMGNRDRFAYDCVRRQTNRQTVETAVSGDRTPSAQACVRRNQARLHRRRTENRTRPRACGCRSSQSPLRISRRRPAGLSRRADAVSRSSDRQQTRSGPGRHIEKKRSCLLIVEIFSRLTAQGVLTINAVVVASRQPVPWLPVRRAQAATSRRDEPRSANRPGADNCRPAS